MAFKIEKTLLPDLYLIEPKVVSDDRGRFVKTFQASAFEEIGLNVPFTEDFFTVSRQNTLRGLHFQIPPFEHDKLVTCLKGRVMDVAVDLRAKSPTYGKFQIFELTGENAKSLFIPAGFAHGFYTLSEEAWIAYKVTKEYAPAHDAGIRWDSLEIPWPNLNPTISPRDKGFPKFDPNKPFFP